MFNTHLSEQHQTNKTEAKAKNRNLNYFKGIKKKQTDT